MGRKKLTNVEKSRALTLLEMKVPVIRVAAELKVTRQAVYDLKKAAVNLPPGTVPKRKPGSGRQKKTSSRTDAIIKREVMAKPSITAAELKRKHQQLLQNVSIRTIQHRLQKDLGLPARRAAKKPLLTAAMKKKRLQFCNKYKTWTPHDWRKVMFSDESTFRLVRGCSTVVRRPTSSSRYDSRFTVKTVKHPDSVMVWGAISGSGRAGLYFLPKNVTMKGSNYLEVLQDHMLDFWDIHDCNFFMHDGAPAHRTKTVKKWLEEKNIPVLAWPGNSPDLNPIENAWNYMKKKVQDTQPPSIQALKEELKKLWVNMDKDYCVKLADSMPQRLASVLKAKGDMTKY